MNRLGHQHVLTIWPSDENMNQQLPAPRLRVHQRGLLLRWKAEEGVDQQETVFRPGSQKKEAVMITAIETVETQHSLSGCVFCSDGDVQFFKDVQFVHLRRSQQEGVQFLV
ncbi:unnamed protein product [Schistocephalus solidus]|uniref:Fibronectin type-III domain-containing protein n=1 Tax=Schistocephalus solidus TaxID=70667 RepID=A0A183SU17_SCHSO|nr:unnamed protein product [Schistocephalus solidus]